MAWILPCCCLLIALMSSRAEDQLLLDEEVTDFSEVSKKLNQKQIMYLSYFVGNLSIFDCIDDDPVYSPEYWLNLMTSEERHKWNQPIQGVWRSQFNVTYPCDKSAWVKGKWQAVPMWSHSANKGFGIARCPERVIETPTHCPYKLDAISGKCADDTTLLCPPFTRIQRGNAITNESPHCLVYTFGIATLWEFEDWIGEQGCEVHAHDPTTKFFQKHQAHSSKNVHFHYEGLKSHSLHSTAASLVTHGYGKLGGNFSTLGELWEKHGHRAAKRNIDIIKIDCEGCEWESFVYSAKQSPEVFHHICTIVMEVHVVTSLQMRSWRQLILMSEFWRLFIEEMGYRLWYVHKNPGAKHDRKVNPFLLHLGLEENICCYEIALHREAC